ncbi:mandelate racemase [Mycolicibacterium moriokaense]|nr:mandelate racemase [Mycolicibacterium moriokaense]
MTADCAIDAVNVGCYRFPTPTEESDGTLSWDATTAVTVELTAGGTTGLGWTYSDPAAATLIEGKLAAMLRGHPFADISAAWTAMRAACRNLGTKGLTMQAISAVDIAMWDLKARMLKVPLSTVFGRVRERVPVYGSGGFTSESDSELAQSVEMWRAAGCRAMKIKIGRDGGRHEDWDLDRMAYFRKIAGPATAVMVDANGAYTVGQARRVGLALDRLGGSWFEEPVTSDDDVGLAHLRGALACDVTAGEYVSDSYDAARMAAAVDCLQLDATRCGGYTGLLRGAAVAHAHNIDVSCHCAPALHAPVAAAVPHLRHIEWFADHMRLEPKLVDGAPLVSGGAIAPATGSVGHGMTLAETAAAFDVAR